MSRQAQIESVADALTMADRAGGVVTVIYGRTSLGREGEMVTPEILVNWRDRADAKPQYEEPVAFEPQEDVNLGVAPIDDPFGIDGKRYAPADPEDVEAQMEAEGRLDSIEA